jgi:hypothetical protein
VGFFKASTSTPSSKAAARMHGPIWVLIYGGLLTLVLGLSVAPIDDETAWTLIVGGGVVTAVGVALIVVRAKMKIDS